VTDCGAVNQPSSHKCTKWKITVFLGCYIMYGFVDGYHHLCGITSHKTLILLFIAMRTSVTMFRLFDSLCSCPPKHTWCHLPKELLFNMHTACLLDILSHKIHHSEISYCQFFHDLMPS